MKNTVLLLWITLLAACSSLSSGSDNHVTLEAGPEWEQQADQRDALLARVHREWDRNITMKQVRPPSGTTIRITVRFYSDGGEPVPLSIQGGTKKSRKACAQALMTTTKEWTEEMIQDLGTQQVITFTFVYA